MTTLFSMTPISEGEQILKFIPQRSPMVMIDKLFFSNQEKCTTGLFITEENIFCRDGFFREPGLIENMAQTAAVQAGYNTHPTLPKGGHSNTLSDDGMSDGKVSPNGGDLEGVAVPIGFIGAIKDLKIHFLPSINSEIVTEIKITHQIFDATVVNASISSNGEKVAECELKIFIRKE